MVEFEMEPNAYFEWDAFAWDYFRTCPEMVEALESVGEQVKRTAEGLSVSGEARYDWTIDEHRGKKGTLRAVLSVHPASIFGDATAALTLASNLKHNSLVKGVKRARV